MGSPNLPVGVFTDLSVVHHGFVFALKASVFSLFGQRKVTKRKATPKPQPAKVTAGSLVGRNRRGR
jgi:hypothetical protein